MKLVPVLIGGAVGLGAVLWFRSRGVTGAAAEIGAGIVRAADGVVGGAVVEVGKIVGIPATDAAKAAEARAKGDIYEASKYMPAGDFIGWLWKGAPTGGASGSW